MKPKTTNSKKIKILAIIIVIPMLLFLLSIFRLVDLPIFYKTHKEAASIARDAHFSGCTSYKIKDINSSPTTRAFSAILFTCSPKPYVVSTKELSELGTKHGYKPNTENWTLATKNSYQLSTGPLSETLDADFIADFILSVRVSP